MNSLSIDRRLVVPTCVLYIHVENHVEVNEDRTIISAAEKIAPGL